MMTLAGTGPEPLTETEPETVTETATEPEPAGDESLEPTLEPGTLEPTDGTDEGA